MKNTLIFIILYLLSYNSFSQAEASNWYFGFGAGVSFNQINGNISSVDDGRLFTNEGCTTISDSSGNLLFYTDGSSVWNKNHSIMTNGTGLFGDPSSTQSAIIVPKPNTPDIYYIFTADDHNRDETHLGLNYSEVDMTLSGGLGAVTNKNINLLRDCSEKLSAVVKDCFTKSIWVVTFASENGLIQEYNTFHAYEVSDSGVNTTSIKSTFPIAINDYRGNLKLSPDGKKMACANVRADRDPDNLNIADRLYLYDFDSASGKASNARPLILSGNSNAPYGVEFSPNSELLYINASNDYFGENRDNPSEHSSQLAQFNLLSADIQNSAIIIDDRQLYRGGLQLGPDGKIYRALSATYNTGLPYLGVINNPNNLGTACNYQHNAINISPNQSTQGLPPFIQSFFNEKIDIINNGTESSSLVICNGSEYTLTAPNISGASYTWTRDKNPLSTGNRDLKILISGNYEVFIDLNDGNCGALEGQAFVTYSKNPDAFNYTLTQCDEDGFADELTMFNLNEANDNLTGNATDVSTKFHKDAARTIEINGDAFPNTTNPQIIYVELINDVSGCSSFSELTLNVSTTATKNTILPKCDDDGIEDGFHIFNLPDADHAILTGLPAGLTTVYYQTYNDALLEQNKLAASFTNNIPYSQTIYARIENTNICYGISEVELIVNELPDIEINDFDYYCLNKFPKTISINAGFLKDSPNNYTYNWSNGASDYEIQINKPETYTVDVINSNGCLRTRTVIIEPSNKASFDAPDPFKVNDFSENNTITVFVSGEGTYQYALHNEDDKNIVPFQDSNNFENVFPGIYNVKVKDVKNDCGTVNEDVSVIGFPKVFTPNNDGINDFWQILGQAKMFSPNARIFIFNRFGKLIKQLDPLDKGWNGLLNGVKLPSDDYWFSIKLQDGRIFKNHFTLKY